MNDGHIPVFIGSCSLIVSSTIAILATFTNLREQLPKSIAIFIRYGAVIFILIGLALIVKTVPSLQLEPHKTEQLPPSEVVKKLPPPKSIHKEEKNLHEEQKSKNKPHITKRPLPSETPSDPEIITEPLEPKSNLVPDEPTTPQPKLGESKESEIITN